MTEPGQRFHPTALIDPEARLAGDVVVGPYCVIGPRVRLGTGCRLESHVVIQGDTEIGEHCRFSPFASIGGPPQDLKFRGESTRLRIGSSNVFREGVTVHVGTAGGGGETRIGDGNYFMAQAHIAHDCQIGNEALFANAATLAGHVTIQDGATIGAFSGIHQFCRVGRQAFIGGYSVVTQDALPFVLTVGNRATSHGINVIGLERRGLPATTIRDLRRAYRTLFRSRLRRDTALATATESWGGVPEVAELIAFVRESRRGVTL